MAFLACPGLLLCVAGSSYVRTFNNGSALGPALAHAHQHCHHPAAEEISRAAVLPLGLCTLPDSKTMTVRWPTAPAEATGGQLPYNKARARRWNSQRDYHRRETGMQRKNVAGMFSEVCQSIEKLCTSTQRDTQSSVALPARLPRGPGSEWQLPHFKEVAQFLGLDTPYQFKRVITSASTEKVGDASNSLLVGVTSRSSAQLATTAAPVNQRRTRQRIAIQLQSHAKKRGQHSRTRAQGRQNVSTSSCATDDSPLERYAAITSVTLSEVHALKSQLQAREAENHLVTADHFVAHVGARLPPEEYVRGLDENVFVTFDHGRNGRIDWREFILELAVTQSCSATPEEIIDLLFELYAEERPRASRDDDSTWVSSGIRYTTLAKLTFRGAEQARAVVLKAEAFLHALDADGDGEITWHEFCGAVMQDRSILETFRNALGGKQQRLSMLHSLLRFLRRCPMSWIKLTDLWNRMSSCARPYRIRSVDHSESVTETELSEDYKLTLIEYDKFQTILRELLGDPAPSDARIITDLFEAATLKSATVVGKNSNIIDVVDAHRFVSELATAMEDSNPEFTGNTVARARFYFVLLDLDHSGTIEYDEVYTVIRRGQTSAVATSLLNGRQALKLIQREPDGFILKERIANAVECTPSLLRTLIHR